MTTNFGAVPASSVLPIMFCAYNSSGASVTLTGLAVTDIEIYKGTSMTQRASDAGYTLLDTDGIDIDTVTGLHGFSIDLGDNTDAGFYAAGSFYNVVVSAVTIDSQTVTLLAATFRIVAAENTAGTPVADVVRISGDATSADNLESYTDGTTPQPVNVTQFGGTNGTFAAGRAEVNTSHIAGSAVSTSTAQIGVNVVNAGGTAWASGSLTSGVFATGAITATAIAADAIGASELAADAVAEIADAVWDEDATGHQTQGTFGQAIGDPGADTDTIWALANTNLNATVSSRASQTSVDTIDDFLDTEIAAIKAKTDSLTFTTANRVDSQVFGMEAGTVTSAAVATGAIDADALATDAVNEIQAAVAAGAVASVTGNVGGNVTGSIGSLAAQAKTDVNAEVVDALATDTYAEPAQGAPGATATLATKMGFLYKAWRNKSTQTSTTYSLFNDDAATVDHKATVSDDGTTATKGEVATGP